MRVAVVRGLHFVARYPPFGKDFLDAQFSHDGTPLWLKFGGYVLNGNAHELKGDSLLGVGEIVVAMRQISGSDKTTGQRSCKIREGYRVSAGVGLIYKGKCKRVCSSHERIFTLGAYVPWIFMQGKTYQKAGGSQGSGRGERVSIEPAKCPGAIHPFLRIVAFWIGHAHRGAERRKDNRGRPKCLMSIDREFLVEGETMRSRDWQEQYSTVLVLRTERRAWRTVLVLSLLSIRKAGREAVRLRAWCFRVCCSDFFRVIFFPPSSGRAGWRGFRAAAQA